MSRCILKKPGTKANQKCFEDGLLLLETYLPKLSQLDGRVEAVFHGMKETAANEGKYATEYITVSLLDNMM